MRPEDIELSRRYTDILRARGNADSTIDNYLYSVKGLAQFLGERGLKSADADDIVAYQIAIAASGRSDSCVRVATYALRGFLEHVLERADAKLAKLPCPRQPKRLPEVPGSVHAVLRGGVAYRRGGASAPAPHRLGAHVDPGRAGQGQEGPPGDALLASAGGATRLLEALPARAIPDRRQASWSTHRRDQHPAGIPGSARARRRTKARHSAFAAQRVGMVPTFQRLSGFSGNWSCPATGRGSLWP